MDQNPTSTSSVTLASTDPVSATISPDPTDVTTPNVPTSNPAAISAPAVPSLDDSPVVTPDPNSVAPADSIVVNSDAPLQVGKKIADAQNVLIALSSDPSVDEMAAAIGLSLYLDKLGKRATAIYSGTTPNALEFLKPEDTFESTADTLQDFVIALNKDKADHLRYKLDGDYVKIFITPYKSRIDEKDLEFSYGDFNIDLVLALDVANGIDLDSALREHGRIMHDAVIINITTGNPGRFGEIEWSDKSASSVSEMIAKLLYELGGNTPIEKDEATAFLTGIVAATDRFSNAKTVPSTMQIASKLMESGANQQLISQNITPDVDNELYSLLGPNTSKRSNDPTDLDIKHYRQPAETTELSEPSTSAQEASPTVKQPSALLEDLKVAEANLAATGTETTPDNSNQPIDINNIDNIPPSEPQLGASTGILEQPEKVIQPLENINLEATNDSTQKYGKMLEEALSGAGETAAPTSAPMANENPATMITPQVPTNPEINGVPEINYMPLPDEEVLPPPPAPPIDMSMPVSESATSSTPLNMSEPTPVVSPTETPGPSSTTAISKIPTPAASPETVSPVPSMPAVDNTVAAQASLPPLGAQPAMQDQVYNPPAADPGAFKIPGM